MNHAEKPLLLTFNPGALPTPQVIAICPECGNVCRWAPRYIVTFDGLNDYGVHERRGFYMTPESVERCYHCHMLFSPNWQWERHDEPS